MQGDRNKSQSAPMSRSKINAARQAKQMGAAREVKNYLISMDGKTHNGPAARILAAASAWAYSDLNTFATVMGAFGLSGEFLAVNLTNEPNLIDTTAYLFVSSDRQTRPDLLDPLDQQGQQGQQELGKLAILAFRGTSASNTINWLTDANTLMEPLGEGGRAHGGFLRGGIVLMPLLKALLLSVSEGKTLKQALKDIQQSSIIPKEAFPQSLQKGSDSFEESDEERAGGSQTEQKPLALYITGHGLGGAFAALTAAAIHLDPEMAQLQMNPQTMGNQYMNQQMNQQQGAVDPSNPQNMGIQSGLRSVYTFGQPMFADRNLALMLEGKFGERLFRHVYKNDIVPRLPPRITGNFAHFGREFVATGGVWVRNQKLMRQAYMNMLGNVVGTVAWIKDMMPIAQWLPMQFAWGDHSPLNYLRVSKAQPSGFATPGDELGSTVPGLC